MCLDATTKDFADDVKDLIDWAKQQSDVDTSQIILIGHSEGGIVATMVASERDDIAKVVMLAGPVITGRKTVLDQTRKIAEAAGAAREYVEIQDRLIERVIEKIIAGEGLNMAFIDQALQSEVDKNPSAKNIQIPQSAKNNLLAMDTDWFRYFFQYDPAPALEKTKCPILFIIGENDLQVSPELNVPIVEKIFAKRPNKDCKIIRMPDLNHLFQKSKTGLPGEYRTIEESFNTAVLDKMVNWIKGG